MIEQFKFWLSGIVEDDYIPYEIKNICFVYTNKNNCFTLAMGGTEFKPNLNNMFDYFPLEAQFFFCPIIQKIKDKDYYENLMKTTIDEAFESNFLKKEFINKHIYFGECGSSLEFLFVVKKI